MQLGYSTLFSISVEFYCRRPLSASNWKCLLEEDPLLALLNSTCIINSTMVHFINWSSNWMHFPWSRQQQRWIMQGIVNSAEMLDLNLQNLQPIRVSESTNPVVHFHTVLPNFPQILYSWQHCFHTNQKRASSSTASSSKNLQWRYSSLWRQIMTVSSGRDFDQSKASFLRLSCQIGWAKSIFHLDCWL